jgi:hypothetical protein
MVCENCEKEYIVCIQICDSGRILWMQYGEPKSKEKAIINAKGLSIKYRTGILDPDKLTIERFNPIETWVTEINEDDFMMILEP